MSILLFLVIAYFCIQFIRGISPSKKILAELSSEIPAESVTKAGLFGVVFLFAAFVTSFPFGPLIYFIVPVPLSLALCIPGLIVMHKLSGRLERAGTDRVKPITEWLDKGKFAGWGTSALAIASWGLSISTGFLGSITGN